MSDDKHGLMKVVWCYAAVSLLAAFLSPLAENTFLESVEKYIPVVLTMNRFGDEGRVTLYFLTMYALLPIVTAMMIRRYPVENIVSADFTLARTVGFLVFFISSAWLMCWLVFLMPPNKPYVGTRIKFLIFLASNTSLGLGVLYGLFFICLAGCLCCGWITLRHLGFRKE